MRRRMVLLNETYRTIEIVRCSFGQLAFFWQRNYMAILPVLGTMIWIGGGSLGLVLLIIIIVLLLRK
jgi:hypothetical protein